MTILDARDIAPEKARSLFDVTLGEFLVLAECAKAITNNHGCSPTRNTCKRVYCPLDKYPRYVFMSTVEELLGEEEGSLHALFRGVPTEAQRFRCRTEVAALDVGADEH